MAKRCYICGKGPMTGNNVSHSHKATKRRWVPNLQKIKIMTENGPKRVWVCTECIKEGRVQKVVNFPKKKVENSEVEATAEV